MNNEIYSSLSSLPKINLHSTDFKKHKKTKSLAISRRGLSRSIDFESH